MHNKNKKVISLMLAFIMTFLQSHEALAATNVQDSLSSIASGIVGSLNISQNVKANNDTANIDKKKLELDARAKEVIEKAKENNIKKDLNKKVDTKISGTSINFIKSIDEKTNAISWNSVPSSEYDLEIDGKVISMGTNTGYFHKNLNAGEEHAYRVRVKNSLGTSEWSEKITKKTTKDSKKESVASKSIVDASSVNKVMALTDANYAQTTVITSVHVIGRDWMQTEQEELIGQIGDTVDAIKIQLKNVPAGMKVKYRAYVNGVGWQPWVYDGAMVGEYGKQLQAIEVRLVQITDGNVEKTAEGYNIQYGLYCSDGSNVSTISKDGETSGIIGKAASAFQVTLINSAEFVKSFIDKDTRWTLSGSPYVIEGQLIINQNVKLEIDPGVKVIFKKYASRVNGIEVNGTLVANGNASAPINFTYSEDGNLVSSDNYTYKGIEIKPTGQVNANYINIDQKDIYNPHIDAQGALNITNSSINTSVSSGRGKFSQGIVLRSDQNMNVQNNTITNCLTGIAVKNIKGAVNIQGNRVNDNDTGISLFCIDPSSTAQVTVKDNTEINRNKYGVYVAGKSTPISSYSITNNSIDSSKNSGIYVDVENAQNIIIQKNNISRTNADRANLYEGPIFIRLDGIKTSANALFTNLNSNDAALKNNLSSNNYDAIVILGTINNNLYLPKGYNKYLVDYALNVPSGKVLDIEPGAVVNIRGCISVDGILNAEGKSTLPIVFTSLNDPSYGAAHTSASGYDVDRDKNFEAIYIMDKGEFRGTNTKIRYGGKNYNQQVENHPSNIKVWGKATIINSEVGESLTEGVFASGAINIINTKIYNCADDGVTALGEISLVNSNLTQNKNGLLCLDSVVVKTIVSNSFVKNKEYGLWNVSSAKAVDAQYNYWGSEYGPSYYDNNTHTDVVNGDKVSDKVNYKPYLASEYKANLGDEFNKYINTVEYKAAKHFGIEGTNSATGNFSKSYDDLTCSVAGYDLKITRTYNSLDNKDSIIGKGWRFAFQGDVSDYTNESNVKSKVVKLPNGSVQTFKENSDGTYTANDSRSILIKQSDNTMILTTKDQYKYGFNANGKLTYIKDKNENTIYIGVAADGKITTISDDAGRTFTINYVNNLIDNIVEKINGTSGRTIKYSYTGGLLSSVTDALGNVTIYEYDSNQILSKIKDNKGNIYETITYFADGDNKGKVKEHKDIYGNNHVYTYDNVNNRTLITDSNNKTTEQWYDNEKYITITVYPDGNVSFSNYFLDDGINKYGEISSETNRDRKTYSYERDARGNRTKAINPDLSFKTFQYDDKNNIIREADEDGKFTFYVYDSEGKNLKEKAQPLDGLMEYKPGAVDKTKFAITSYSYYTEAERLQLGYKVKGLLKTTTDPNGNSITNTYFPNGNLKTVENQEKKVTNYNYDDLGFKKNSVSPKQFKIDYVYDKNGNLEKTVLNGGETTRIVYDSFGRKVKEVNAKQYNSVLDDLENHQYSGDHGLRYQYYLSGKLWTVKDSENNTTTYDYDLYGNVKKEAKPNGAVYTYDYDDMNRLTKTTFKENVNAAPIILEENQYTILSDGKTQKANKKYISDTEANYTYYTYDYADRLVEQKNADNTTTKIKLNPNGTKYSETDENNSTAYYDYDGLNRLIHKWIPFEDSNGVVKYTYSEIQYDKDGNKKVEKIGKDAVEKDKLPAKFIVASYDYYKDGKLKATVDNEGRRVEYTYDDDGYLSSEQKYIDTTKKVITDYTNNYFGKPETKVEHVQACDLFGTSYTNTEEKSLTTKYTYDKNGNVETVTTPEFIAENGYKHDSIVTTYTYDSMNRNLSESVPGKDESGNSVNIIKSTTYNWEGNKDTVTDELNYVTRYSYNQRGLLDKITDAKGGITAYYYDRAGRKIAEVSPKNYNASKTLAQMERTEYNYDSVGRVKTIINKFYDKSVNATNYQWVDNWVEVVSKAYKYDGKGNKLKELDALGYEAGTGSSIDDKINSGYGTEYSYNLAGKLITKIDPVSKERKLSFTNKYEYDALGRKTGETNAKGVITSYNLDDAGNIKAVKVKKDINSPEQVIQQKDYDFLGRVTSVTDGKLNKTAYYYNSFNKVSKVTYPGDDTIAEGTVLYQYDVLGNLKKKQDSEGKISVCTYDSKNRATSEKSYQNDKETTTSITTSTIYDKAGNKRFEYDGNGNLKENVYDELNRVKAVKEVTTDIDGVKTTHNTSYNYDSNGNQISLTDWRNNNYTNVYDALNRLIEKQDPYASIQKLEFNHNNRQIKSYDALNNMTEYKYDKNNRLLSTTDAERHTISQDYDNVGSIQTKTDGKKHTTTFEYNEFNKPIKVINAKNEITQFSYDLNNNMITQTDGKGNITTFEYNVANNVKKRVDQGGRLGVEGSYTYKPEKTESYTYYSDGKLKEKVDRNGKSTKYEHNLLGKPLKETAGSIVISYTYDNNGNQLTVTDNTGTITRSYDELNRVKSKNVSNIGETKYKYDVIINRTDMPQGSYAELSIDPKGNNTTKVFDKASRVKYVLDGNATAAITATYDYYNNGRTKSIAYSSGAREDYNYYNNNLLKSLENKKADGSTIEKFLYEYDEANNQTKKTDKKGVTSYTYDELNRIQSVTEPNRISTSYLYDKAGNRQNQAISQNGSILTNTAYSYNEQNRLTTATASSGSKDEITSYTYDNNGNLVYEGEGTLEPTNTSNSEVFYSSVAGENENEISKKINFYEYDDLNRLTKELAGGKTSTYEYNGEDLRVSKTVDGQTTRFLYEGDKVVLELDNASNQKARNIYGNNLLSRKIQGDSKNYYYMYNGHGDVTTLVDGASNIAATYYYDAFGKEIEKTGNVDNPIRYAGYQYDEETKNYYLMSRMYDPTTARFLQEDTYRGDINDPLSLNLYTYCHNNPVTYDDPNGHWIHIAIGAAIGAAISTAVTAYNDYKDDHKFNAGWRTYLGAAAEGAILGAVGAATMGSSLLAMTAAGAAAGFAGSIARQYISDGKVSYKSAAKDGIINGLGTLGFSVGGKALGAAGRYLSETKAVERVKGVVLDGLSSNSESLAAINKKIGSSMQGLMEKIKLPESKLAFETGNGSLGKSTYSSAMEYADKNVMDNFNKVYANREEIQTAVKVAQGSIDEVGESVAKGVGETEKLYNVRGNMVTEKEFDRLRQQAVRKAWKQEEDLVRETGRGTYDWNEDEIKDLLTPYKDKGYRGVKGYEGQHMKSAKEYPDFVDDPDNIQFLKGRNIEIKEHFQAHGENYQNPTNGYYDPKTKVTVDFGDEAPWKK